MNKVNKYNGAECKSPNGIGSLGGSPAINEGGDFTRCLPKWGEGWDQPINEFGGI